MSEKVKRNKNRPRESTPSIIKVSHIVLSESVSSHPACGNSFSADLPSATIGELWTSFPVHKGTLFLLGLRCDRLGRGCSVPFDNPG